jgi:murein DD-endopeptidase MepM/ murein hydrolase activator NlpD
VYGEVASSVTHGQSVEAGDVIGTVKQVLKVDKGTPMSMLHLELYSQRPVATAVWGIGEPQPDYLMNPMQLFSLC